MFAGSYFGNRSTPRVTAVTRIRPRSFCQNCRWKVTPKYAYIFDPTKSEWADYAVVQAQCWNLSRNKLTRNLSRIIWPKSSQFTEPLWTYPAIKTGISVPELISLSDPASCMLVNHGPSQQSPPPPKNSSRDNKVLPQDTRIPYHVTNEEMHAKIQQAIGPHEDLTIVKRRKPQWYGHVSRSSGLAKTVLQGTVKGGRRQGR